MRDNSEFTIRFHQQLLSSYKQINKSTKPMNWRQSVRLYVKLLAAQILKDNLLYLLQYKNDELRYFLNHLEELRSVYSWLGDDYSKSLLLQLIIRKIPGFQHFTSLIDESSERKRFEHASTLIIEEGTHNSLMGATTFRLGLYNLFDIGYSIHAYMHQMNVVWTFMSEQYRYKHENVEIGVEPGDVAIDAGGCWGDTALYMASKNARHVYSFEFANDNLIIFNDNLDKNPVLAQAISIVQKAVWDEDDAELNFEANGPATQVFEDDDLNSTVHTVSIDTFTDNNVERVDFIKMDIEGAELRALKGAKNTIIRFGPRLAITVYHKPEDLWTIPHYIKSLQGNYVFYLDHFTTTMDETVLFAALK